MQYKFLNLKQEHLHQISDDGENWKPLLGTSSVVGVLNKNGLTYWASGLAVGKLGWTNPKNASKEQRLDTVVPYLENIKQMQPEAFLALLDDAYKAHATKLKDSALSGTDMHAELEAYRDWETSSKKIGRAHV